MSFRVLMIVDSLFPLGPAHQMSVLGQQLANAGEDVHVAVLHDRPDRGFPVPSGCRIHYLEIDKRDWLGWKKISALAETIQPDLCHDWSAEAITRAALAGRVPHVSSHGFEPRTKQDVSVWLKNCWNGQPANQIRRVANHKRIQIALQAESTKSNAPRQRQGRSDSEVVVIPPGIEPIELNRALAREKLLERCKLKPGCVLAGIYAPLVPATRLKDVIWAIDLMSCVIDDVHLVVIGEGTQHDRLKRFLRCTAAPSQVHFVGEPSDSLDVLAGLDVYWHSHLLWPLPVGLLTAMRTGIPAISVLGEGTESIVIHQTTGFGVNIGARDEFARWTKFLVDLKEPAQQLASQGQSHVERLFPVDSMVQRYRSVYESLV